MLPHPHWGNLFRTFLPVRRIPWSVPRRFRLFPMRPLPWNGFLQMPGHGWLSLSWARQNAPSQVPVPQLHVLSLRPGLHGYSSFLLPAAFLAKRLLLCGQHRFLMYGTFLAHDPCPCPARPLLTQQKPKQLPTARLPVLLPVFPYSGAALCSQPLSRAFPAGLSGAFLQTVCSFPLLPLHCSKAGGTCPPASGNFPLRNVPGLSSASARGVPGSVFPRAPQSASGHPPARA